jgi:uncharacterized damage-inducible protein DinB
MLYSKISDFLSDWQNDSESTLKIFKALTNKSLEQAVVPGGRTIGIIAWHITQAVPEMINRTGLTIDRFDEKAEEPADVKTIIDSYEYFSKKLVEEISSKWKDADMEKEVNMYGQMWKNGVTLQILISHQIHHRAQLTVLMRQAGLMVPGIMGPSKEEWAAMGMPPQK